MSGSSWQGVPFDGMQLLMSVDLDRALNEWEYRESIVSVDHPLVVFLKRAGAYAYDDRELVDYNDWNGALVGSGPGGITRPAIALDPALPFSELEALLTRGVKGRLLVAQHPATPLATLRSLIEDDAHEIPTAVLKHPLCDEGLLERACRSRWVQVREAAAGHPRLTLSLIEFLLQDAAVRMRVAWRKDLDARMLARIVDVVPDLRASVAAHPNVTTELLLVLAESPSPVVREAVAKNPRATSEAIERLANQTMDGRTRSALASHPATPPPLLNQLVEDVTLRKKLALRRDLPPEAQLSCARDKDYAVRQAIAEHGNQPAALEALLTDPSTGTRTALARNPNCTHFVRLAADEMSPVRAAIAGRADAPVALLQKLAQDSQTEVSRIAERTLEKLEASAGG